MGCGKLKYDVVMGNIRMVRKFLDVELVKGKESEIIRK